MLEKLHLTKALLCFFEGFIRPTEIFSLGGNYLESTFYFLDHHRPPEFQGRKTHLIQSAPMRSRGKRLK